MKRMLIYYFSGTGNAKQIAEWLHELTGRQDISAILCDITGDLSGNFPLPEDRVVLISPIHGFNYPPATLHFIHQLPSGQNDIILMCTRAGFKLGSFITPGVTGLAFLLAAAMLKKKGYTVIDCMPFDMPSNWLTLHPALRKNATDFIFAANYKRLEKFFDKISTGVSMHQWGILSGILLFTISAAYYVIGRFFLAKTLYASNDCTKCGKCIENCPLNALIYKNERPYWTMKCESCMRCINICPTRSIQAGHLIILIAIFLSYVFAEVSSCNIAVKIILFSIMLLAVQSMLYAVQHRLLHIPFIAKIIKQTSFTYYKFWGRYKNPNT